LGYFLFLFLLVLFLSRGALSEFVRFEFDCVNWLAPRIRESEPQCKSDRNDAVHLCAEPPTNKSAPENCTAKNLSKLN